MQALTPEDLRELARLLQPALAFCKNRGVVATQFTGSLEVHFYRDDLRNAFTRNMFADFRDIKAQNGVNHAGQRR